MTDLDHPTKLIQNSKNEYKLFALWEFGFLLFCSNREREREKHNNL